MTDSWGGEILTASSRKGWSQRGENIPGRENGAREQRLKQTKSMWETLREETGAISVREEVGKI